MNYFFPESYEESRDRFRSEVVNACSKWKDFKLEAYYLKSDVSLSIDYAWVEPNRKENLIIISTGLHGIEGYVGSAMLKLFMDEFLPRLENEHTGLLLIHAINPSGMKNYRRYNENNADLNRNFVWNGNFDPDINPDYEKLRALVNPPRPLSNLILSDFGFLVRLVASISQLGITRLRQGMLSGQYRHPKGVQFGGQFEQESSLVVNNLLKKALEEYEQVVHLDMHSGYGPRYQMSFVNSIRELVPTKVLREEFKYPLIVAANPEEFYVTSGDITEYFYELKEEKYPAKRIFATCFEFGTFGDSIIAQIRSMRATILENRLFHFGAHKTKDLIAIKGEYKELFYPSETKWREKAVSDCRQAFQGVFSAFGLLRAEETEI